MVAEVLDFFLSSILSIASVHSLHQGEWPESECSPEVRTRPQSTTVLNTQKNDDMCIYDISIC